MIVAERNFHQKRESLYACLSLPSRFASVAPSAALYREGKVSVRGILHSTQDHAFSRPTREGRPTEGGEVLERRGNGGDLRQSNLPLLYEAGLPGSMPEKSAKVNKENSPAGVGSFFHESFQ